MVNIVLPTLSSPSQFPKFNNFYHFSFCLVLFRSVPSHLFLRLPSRHPGLERGWPRRCEKVAQLYGRADVVFRARVP